MVQLRTHEPVPEHFAEWDRQGRVPDGAVLLEHVGTCCGLEKHGGMKVVAGGDGFGPVGSHPSVARLEASTVVSQVHTPGPRARAFMVLVPEVSDPRV